MADLAERVFDDVEVVDQPLGVDPVQASPSRPTSCPWTWLRTSLFSTNRSEQADCWRAGAVPGRTPAPAGARMALQPLEAQQLRADRVLAAGIDQHDRHGLEITSRDTLRFDGGRIHAVNVLELF